MPALASWHHSDEMTLDKMDVSLMLKDIKVCVAYIVPLSAKAVFPFEHVSVPRELKDRLDTIASSGGDAAEVMERAADALKKV